MSRLSPFEYGKVKSLKSLFLGVHRGDLEHEGFSHLVWVMVGVINSLLCMGIVALLMISFDQTQKRAYSSSASDFTTFMHGVNESVEDLSASLSLLKAEREVQMASGREDAQLMERLIKRLEKGGEGLYTLVVTDGDGRVLHGAAGQKLALADRSYFKDLKTATESVMVMSELFTAGVDKRQSVEFALPLLDSDKQFAGLVVARVELKRWEKDIFLTNSLIDASTSLIVRDLRTNKALMVKGQSEGVDLSKLNTGAKMPNEMKYLISTGKQNKTYVTSDTVDHRPRTVTFGLVANAPLLLEFGVDNEVFFQSWRVTFWSLVGVMMCFMLGSISFAVSVVKNDKTVRFAREQIEQVNEELELKVAARTSELEKTLELVKQTRLEWSEHERLASLGAMVSDVAHELNTPLGNALLSSSALKDLCTQLLLLLETPGQKTSRATLVSKVIRLGELTDLQTQSIERAAGLVKAFKQVAVDQASARRRVFNLKETIENTLASFKPVLNHAQTQVQISVTVPDSIECDSHPGAVIQIVSNLIQNALKHAFENKPHGHIEISADTVWLNELKAEGVQIIFKDNGVGMSEEVRAHVFDEFFTTKASDGGSGVGLSLSYELAKSALGGDLSVQSWPGVGSTFTLVFPSVAVDAYGFDRLGALEKDMNTPLNLTS